MTLDNWYNKLTKHRGSLSKLDFQKIINSLFLFRHLNAKFDKFREQLKQEGRESQLENNIFYSSKSITFLPKEARWEEIMTRSDYQGERLEVCLDNAFKSIPALKKIIVRDDFFSDSGIQRRDLRALMEKVKTFYFESTSISEEEFIDNFQNLLNEFAKEIENFEKDYRRHTCPFVASLLVKLLDIGPAKARIYDPCFGTARLLLEVAKFIRKNYKIKIEEDFSFYGQEKHDDMHSLARINFAINGIEGGEGFLKTGCTLWEDLHEKDKMDYIVANPPHNQKNWRGEDELLQDKRWSEYDVPPVKNANYAWILHIVDKLSPSGRAAILISQNALSSSIEKRIRQKLIEKDWIEAVILLPKKFAYDDDTPRSILIINKNKKKTIEEGGINRTFKDRTNEICFIDVTQSMGAKIKRNLQLSHEYIEKIARTLRAWRYEELPEKDIDQEIENYTSFTFEEIKQADFSLFPDQYKTDNSDVFPEEVQILDWKEKRKKIVENLLELFEEEGKRREKFLKLFEKKS